VLPAGTQPGHATADDDHCKSKEREDSLVRPIIVDTYVGKGEVGAMAPCSAFTEGNPNDDAMSVSSVSGSANLKRTRGDQDSASDSEVEGRPRRVYKVFRSSDLGSLVQAVMDQVHQLLFRIRQKIVILRQKLGGRSPACVNGTTT